MNYLLDTNFLIAIFRNDKRAFAKAKELEEQGDVGITSSINAAELYEGAYRSKHPSSHLTFLDEMWERFPVIDFSKDHAKEFGRLKSQLYEQELNVNDVLIASVALYMGCTIITKNRKDFEPFGVKIEDW